MTNTFIKTSASADIVIKSNMIYIGTGREILSGGVAVKGDRIIAVGSEREIEPLIGDHTEVFTYKDRLIMPGFIDSHVHVTMGAMLDDNDIDLEGTKSAEECVEIVRDFLKRNPDTSLILACGWMISAWDS